MHPHPAFHLDDRTRHEQLIEAVGFGMVFAATPHGLRVAHTPLLSTATGAVRFHLSNRNALTPHLAGGAALVLVNGPDAYISPRWYAAAGEVPTWNYVALEIEGSVRRLGEDELGELLAAIGTRHEARIEEGEPWQPAQVPQQRWDALLRAITGFELAAEHWRPTFKLSQNKPAATRNGVAEGLEAQGSHELAAWMREVAG